MTAQKPSKYRLAEIEPEGEGAMLWASGDRVRRARIIAILTMVSTMVLITASIVVVYRSHNVRVPLLTTAVAIDSKGAVRGVLPGDEVSFFPGTRVLLAPTKDAAQLAASQRRWVASGTVPGADGTYGEMVREALLDMHTLTSNGALIAGWPGLWHYVWPRDAAFVAVAFAQTGHEADANSLLKFLQGVQPASGIFEARYVADGSGRTPSDRGEESDGTGWALWAVAESAGRLTGHQRQHLLKQLEPLIDRSTAAVLRLTQGASALPPPSLDYWEVSNDRLSLGTAGPIAVGLRAAVQIQDFLGHKGRAAQIRARLSLVKASIKSTFGVDGYPRYRGGNKRDTSVAFLLPPFTDTVDGEISQAWQKAIIEMRRPAGGLAPGAGWKSDGISWTPETAMFALTAAAIGRPSQAAGLLNWLRDHRTVYGALPEKVLSNGRPAGPAPLAFTAALTVLAVAQLDG